MTDTDTPALAYYWGDDGYSVEHAPAELATAVAGRGGPPLEAWRVRGDSTNPAEIAERVATAPLFGGGTLAVVAEPMPLLRSKAERDSLFAALRTVAPGNALAFLETVDGSGRRPASLDSLRDAVEAAGGQVRQFRAPAREEMAGWIEARAREAGIRLGHAAATVLAQRVGAYVREGDVDRRRQGILAVAELEKLAIYRDGGEITADDVRDLVPDVAPGSMWGFLDAVGARRVPEATALAERLLESMPPPVLVSQLHRRIRELLEVADLLATGTPASALPRVLRLKEFRARKLAEQARAWTPAELEGALEGLLELDASVKGIETSAAGAGHGALGSQGATDGQGALGAQGALGGQAGDIRRRLAFTLWLAERVARRG